MPVVFQMTYVINIINMITMGYIDVHLFGVHFLPKIRNYCDTNQHEFTVVYFKYPKNSSAQTHIGYEYKIY